MREERFPTLPEFWRGLERRRTEPDLVERLRRRLRRDGRPINRLGDPAIVLGVVRRILPGSVPAEALASFLDETFDLALGRGDEPAGVLPQASLVPMGFRVLGEASMERSGRPFVALAGPDQDELLRAAEGGELPGPPGFDAAEWFTRVRERLLLGFGSDPRGMVAMGFPGPSFRTGHLWLDLDEVEGRGSRKPGYLWL